MTKPSKNVTPQPQLLPETANGLILDMALAKEEEWYTTEDMMYHFKLSRSSIYRLRVRNKIPALKLGGTIVYPKSLVNKILMHKAMSNLNDEEDSK